MKELVLQDLASVYPGLTRAGVEQVLRVLEDPPLGGGPGLASQVIAIAPDMAARLHTLTGTRLDAYVGLMTGAAALVLQMWTVRGSPPSVAAIVTRVAALSDG